MNLFYYQMFRKLDLGLQGFAAGFEFSSKLSSLSCLRLWTNLSCFEAGFGVKIADFRSLQGLYAHWTQQLVVGSTDTLAILHGLVR